MRNFGVSDLDSIKTCENRADHDRIYDDRKAIRFPQFGIFGYVNGLERGFYEDLVF